MTTRRSLIFLALAATSWPVSAGTASFTAIGTPPGGSHAVNVSATFKNVGGNLEIDLFNNATGTDPTQILSGLVWNVSGTAPSGTALSSALTGSGSKLFTSDTTGTANAELRNSVLGGQEGWQYLAPPGHLNGASFQYGLGCSGLGGTFGGLGNADYGAIGPASDIGHSPLGNQLPLVMSTTSSPSEAVFVIGGFGADVSHIDKVTFAFGSAGTDNLAGTLVSVPEPSCLALASFSLLGLAAWIWRRPKH